MKTKVLSKVLILALSVLVLTNCNQPKQTKVESSEEGTKSIQDYYDELDYQRAVQTYLWSIPAMYMYSLRQSLTETFGAHPSNIPVWEDLMDNETVLLTPNSQVVYTFHFLDLKADGPTVVHTPPGKLAALLDDMWEKPITDMGATGPDQGKGGKYLVLPPGYEGECAGRLFRC